MSEPTARPWNCGEDSMVYHVIEELPHHTAVEHVCTVSQGKHWQANKEHIVKCVNLHEELVEALEAALYSIKAIDEDYDYRESYVNGEKVLVKAKGCEVSK